MQANLMQGKRGLIMGVANDKSIAWGIARALLDQGAEIAFSYQGDLLAKRVQALVADIPGTTVLQCDVGEPDQVTELMQQLQQQWGKLDFLVHSIGFSDKDELQGRFLETSRDNFLRTMDISVYSLLATVKAAESLLAAAEQPAVLTLTYHGSQVAMPNYNVMGVAKAALEAAVRYLAADLGQQNIRVNAISAGVIRTLASSGIRDMRLLLRWSELQAPLGRATSQTDVGKSGLYLLSELAAGVTGEIHYVDSGFSQTGMIPLDKVAAAAEVLQDYSKRGG